MRFAPIAIIVLFPLMAGQPAWAQHTAQPGDGSAADTADRSNPAGATADARPEQAGDLYQSKTPRTGGPIDPPAKRDDPVAGALNPPIEPLPGDRQVDAKE